MLELGKVQTLIVKRQKDFGIYLGEADSEDSVLLPKKQVPEGTKVGDSLEVFLYKDSQDRLIATTGKPLLQLGQVGMLVVQECSKIGAFLNWGLEKDLFLPFKEQSYPVIKGDRCLVVVYIDRTGRLCASMRVYEYLSNESPYQEGDKVVGTIYRINPDLGAFVAVDNKYYGMVPKKDLYDDYAIGTTIAADVVRVRTDGKLDLGLRKKAYLQMDDDIATVLEVLDRYNGVLPFGEKVSPDVIRDEFHLSKNAFKRALGRLLKQGRIDIEPDSIRLRED